MSIRLSPACVALVAAALSASACGDRAEERAPRASGYVEATDVRVAPQVGGRLLEVAVSEGDRVAAGATIAKLDTSDTELALRRAEADRQSRMLRAQGERAAAYLQAQGQAKAIEKTFAAIKAGRPTPEMLAYQYLQTLPQMAKGEANKVWLVPSDFGSALEGFTKMLGAPGSDGVFRYTPSPVAEDLPKPEDDSDEVAVPSDSVQYLARAASKLTDDDKAELIRFAEFLALKHATKPER